jgi:hypothetical protein
MGIYLARNPWGFYSRVFPDRPKSEAAALANIYLIKKLVDRKVEERIAVNGSVPILGALGGEDSGHVRIRSY